MTKASSVSRNLYEETKRHSQDPSAHANFKCKTKPKLTLTEQDEYNQGLAK
jgi:hypothetical protein